jgi:hypothetical protein
MMGIPLLKGDEDDTHLNTQFYAVCLIVPVKVILPQFPKTVS